MSHLSSVPDVLDLRQPERRVLLSFVVDTAGVGWWFILFTAILGAAILLAIVGAVQRGRT